MTRTTPHAAPASPTPHGFRWMRWVPAGLGGILAGVAALYVFWPDWYWVHAEDGPLETAHITFGVVSALVAITIVLTQQGRNRVNGVWLVTLFLLVVARELDLQEQLNEEVLGEWAVSYRLRWWMSWDVPLAIKLMWGAVALLIGAGLVIPLLVVRAPVIRLLLAGDAGTWLFVGGCFFYAAGYLLDDVLGRGVVVDGDQGQVLEETCETIGSVGLLVSTVVTLRSPLMRRIAALPRRTGT